MTTARGHNPSKGVREIETLSRVFSVETARDVVAAVGIPPSPPPALAPPGISEDAEDYLPDVEAAPEDMLFAQLAGRLNDAAVQWGWDEHDQTAASSAMRIKLARRISENCRRLLAGMTDDEGNLLYSLGPNGLWALAAFQGGGSGELQVAKAMTAVRDLQRWATGMANRHEAVEAPREKASSDEGRADHAFHKLLAELGRIFVEFWRRAPGVSRPDQVTPDGPFFRFVASVADELDLRKTNEGLATAISRNPDLRAMRKAMRNDWMG